MLEDEAERYSIIVGCLGHNVVIDAEVERVADGVARGFGEMLSRTAVNGHNLLQVRRHGSTHQLIRDGVLLFSHAELAEVQRILRHEIIRCFVHARPDMLWLHAGAVVVDGNAILLVGPYGRGKSTLVTELCSRGYRYMSDDIVPVDVSSGHAYPFPLTPCVRQGIGTELSSEGVAMLRKVWVRLSGAAFHRTPMPIGGVVLPSYRAGTIARLEPYSPAAVSLDMMREVINVADKSEATVTLCTDLVSRVPVLPLLFSDGAAAADLVLERLARH